MSNFLIARVENYKMASASKVTVEIEHNEKYKNPEWDKDKKEQNVVLIHDADRDGKTFNRYVKEFREKNNVQGRMTTTGKEKSQTNVLTQFVVSASPEYINNLSRSEQNRFFKDAFASLKTQYPTYHWVDVVIHYDEKTPHMHANALPLYYNKEKDILQFSTTKTQEGKYHYREFQDRLFKDMSKNWNVERGISREEREHLSKKEWQERTERDKQLDEREKDIKTKEDDLQKQIDKYKDVPVPQKMLLGIYKYNKEDVERIVDERNILLTALTKEKDHTREWHDRAMFHSERADRAEKSAELEHQLRLELEDRWNDRQQVREHLKELEREEIRDRDKEFSINGK